MLGLAFCSRFYEVDSETVVMVGEPYAFLAWILHFFVFCFLFTRAIRISGVRAVNVAEPCVLMVTNACCSHGEI